MFAQLFQKTTAQQQSPQVLSPNLISLNYRIANFVINCMNLRNACFDIFFSSSIFSMFAKLFQKITAQQQSPQVLSPNLISLNFRIAKLICLFVNVINCMNIRNTCFDHFRSFSFRIAIQL
jgi:hypothetical protein